MSKKVDDYIQAARDAATPTDVPQLNAQYDGVLEQFFILGRNLVDAEAANDAAAIKKYKAVLEENLSRRLELAAKLEAAGDKKSDSLVDAAVAADAQVKP